MNKKILLIALVFIVSCSFLQQQQNQTQEKPAVVKETPATPPNAEPVEEVVAAISCEDSGVSLNQRGKVTLTYSNGQKESQSDSCLEREEPAFKSFKQHYYCENLTIKSKLYNCQSSGNYTCSKGTCI